MSILEIKVPVLGESIDSATIANMKKSVGDHAKADEIICELETDKVTIEILSPATGSIEEFSFKEGDSVKVGTVLGKIKEGADNNPEPKKAQPTTAEPKKEDPPLSTESAPVISKPSDVASPAATKILNEGNVDVNSVNGSGPKGIVIKQDAVQATQEKINQPSPQIANSERKEERIKMSKLRKMIAKRLKDSQNTAAMLTTFNEIDMYNIINLRKKYKESFEKKHGIKLGFMSFFTRASVAALQEIPEINASIDVDDIVYKNYCDISVAVGTPQGLVVPVIRDAQNMSFADIEKTIGSLGKKAKNGNLTVSDMRGGTFTITNGGIYGSLMSTPIINPPQSAILGMHATKEKPCVVNGEIKIRPMMYVALSYDHRIIDGKEAVTFLKKIKEMIEDPVRLLLDV